MKYFLSILEQLVMGVFWDIFTKFAKMLQETQLSPNPNHEFMCLQFIFTTLFTCKIDKEKETIS
jgi:hypothetical protein